MPNVPIWGLPDGDEDQYHYQNLVTPTELLEDEDPAIIRINDVRDPEEEVARTAAHFINSGNLENDRALKAEGKAELAGQVLVGPGNNDGHIDANWDGQQPRTLLLGTNLSTSIVQIGRQNTDAMVNGGLSVMQRLNLNAGMDVIGICGFGNDIHVFGSLVTDTIDAAQNADLNIGTGQTDDVLISQAGKTTAIQGKLVVNDINANDISLMTTNTNGGLDALALKVKGKSKLISNCSFGENGGIVDVEGRLNANSELHANDTLFAESNAEIVGSLTCDSDVSFESRVNHNEQPVILNGALSLTAASGIGLIANMNGHGAGPSIDFFTGGVLRGWVDALGWNNV
ncbi:MAG: hypothetical protein FJY65_06880 [Calditrichaeota bacterium]|nr:hypothetical protein [Calditrichota bacterium]